MLRRTFGLGFPLKLQMEKKAVRQVSRICFKYILTDFNILSRTKN